MEKRAIITVVGKDTVGIIASVCSFLVDFAELEEPFGDMAEELAVIGREKLGVQIKCQKEEIFDSMHRI